MVAILGYSREQIFEAVQDMYTQVAASPRGPYHFPVGEAAGRALGYSREHLDRLPAAVREAFVGVGCPHRAGAVQPGDTVLDIGAGAGCDALVAAERAGPEGRVLALDLTEAMARKAHTNAREAGAANVHAVRASAERLPLQDASVDAITSNGALNLVPDKRRAVAEMFRVLRPGGRLQFADVVIHRPVTVDCREDPRLWVECVVGATVDEDLLALFRDAGFEDLRVVGSHDYFALSPSAQTREIAASFGARSLELAMRRGARAPGLVRRCLQRLDPRPALRRLWRGGFAGAAALVLALGACYGTLGALALLAAAGLGRPSPDEALWAGAIALFTVLTVAALGFGARRHRHPGPALLGAAGAAVVLFALYVHYAMWIEAAGFITLAASVAWDIARRRREQARVLGLEPAARNPADHRLPVRRPE